jgi:hypothetical protein
MRRRAIAAAVALAAAACAGAPRARPLRLAPSSALAEVVAALPPPPEPHSDEAKADLAIVLWMQRTRDGASVERARDDVGLGLHAFASALGDASSPRPRTAALLERAHAAATEPLRAAKARFGRPRPYAADARVHPGAEREESPSYPSGHATRGVLVARVLAELAPAPAQRRALLEAGRQKGYDRVLCGVHYPSDVIAGQRLGDAIADVILADASFRAELDAARAAEWPAARP